MCGAALSCIGRQLVGDVGNVCILQAGDYSVVEIESGVARCPYDPSHNSTALYVGQLSVNVF